MPTKNAAEKNSENNYIEAIGRRKSATSRVRIFPQNKEKIFLINGMKMQDYFPEFDRQKIVLAPLKKTNIVDKFKIEVKVEGGGKKAQSEAIRLGIARSLVKMDNNLSEILKSQGYLTRDPRMKERKKFGLKKARKAPQWSKR
ncbi:MAG TPA: 30S ribosomal protein S9 [Candidatus Pacearchaeota archaeon]|nr:30S ribosomal protein S9 [Candidatus Pacearchaeota archaeon]HOK94266.1 30S ribosomal protein S9 [Candidatus Pacearchaeota archaeon]HPO75380.1 30S ribosomal protein S9 [Candidatus Pacearchaeota archaeon]